jgi:hypothetical protein
MKIAATLLKFSDGIFFIFLYMNYKMEMNLLKEFENYYKAIFATEMEVIEKDAIALALNGYTKGKIDLFLKEHKLSKNELLEIGLSKECESIKFIDLPDVTLESESGVASEIIYYVCKQILHAKLKEIFTEKLIEYQIERNKNAY